GVDGRDRERGERGPQGPVGSLPVAREWQPEQVYYTGQVDVHDGGCFQARHDTGTKPAADSEHWVALALPGRDAKSFCHRGTFKDDAEYASHDIVALSGSAFLALHDAPGACPGPGWQLFAAVGKRGFTGEKGAQGERGPAGKIGLPG